MWTDMSEIVRPTRDGIHGREYISTAVDLGRKPPFLAFEGRRLAAELPPLVSLPMPLILDLSSPAHTLPQLDAVLEQTAVATDLIAIFDARRQPASEEHLRHIAFYLGPDSPPVPAAVLRKTRLVEIADRPALAQCLKAIKAIHPDIVASVRVELTPSGLGRALELAEWPEVEVLHLVADANGNEIGAQPPRFLKDLLRQVHTALVEKGLRDEITIMAGGGIALPEIWPRPLSAGRTWSPSICPC